MQEKVQKFSPIKQRILQFIDTKNISMRDFYTQSGISRGTLESQSGITEDTVAKFIAVYPNISPTWLLYGTGSPELAPYQRPDHDITGNHVNDPITSYGNKVCQQCELRERLLEAKDQTIASLQQLVDELRKKCP